MKPRKFLWCPRRRNFEGVLDADTGHKFTYIKKRRECPYYHKKTGKCLITANKYFCIGVEGTFVPTPPPAEEVESGE